MPFSSNEKTIIISKHTSHSSATNSGTVGTFAGVGSGSWSPILVSSGHTMSGSIIANEDFVVDSLVDIQPYIPANWHPDYSSIRLYLGVDTTGFVLDTTGPGASLAYRHKEGITYPATCRLIAPTNLEYRNYEFSGKIVKPEGAVYDSIGVGVIVYSQGNKWYALKTYGSAYGNNYFYLTKDSLHNEQLVSVILDTINKWEFEGSNDAADFKIQVSTNNDIVGQDTIIDANVKIDIKVWLPIENEPDWDIQRSFVQEQRILSGMPGVYLNNYQPTSLCNVSAQPVRYCNVKLKKVD